MYFDPDPTASIDQRKFRLKQLKHMSPTAKRIDVTSLSPEVFKQIEAQALSEARAASHNSGSLFKTTYRDDGGRKITEFEGDIAAAFGPFMAPGYTAKLNKEPDVHLETVKLRPGQRVQIVG